MRRISRHSRATASADPARSSPLHDIAADAWSRKTTWVLLLILTSGLAARSSWAWDAAPSDFLILDPAATVASAKAAAAAGKLAFDEGTPLKLGCYYKYQGGTDIAPPWRVEFSVDGKPVGSVQAKAPKIATITKSEESVSFDPAEPGIQSTTSKEYKLIDTTFYAEVKWTAAGDGPRSAQCLLNPDKVAGETNVHNNIAQQTITVKRLKPLGGGELPPVSLANPAGSAVFVLGPGLRIHLNAKVSGQATAGKANVLEYAKATAFEEQWHIEIQRKGADGRGGFESRVGEFHGPLDSLQFAAQLNQSWLQQHNAAAGKYAARAYLSQTANGVTVAGPSGRLEFELQDPAQSRAAMPPQDSAVREEMINRPVSIRQPEPSRASGPAGQPMQMEIEAEALAKSGAISVTGGQARAQAMSAFGSGWSGGEQLFWSGGAVGAVLDLIIDVPVASKYAVEMYLTRAPDYGQLRFEVDGKASGVPFDAMAAQVMAGGPTQVGTFPLQAGKRRISLMITGKHAQSTGYYAGIDKLRLYPAGPID